MGKKHNMKQIILFSFLTMFFLLQFFSFNCTSDESSIMIIDLNQSTVYSRENFTVSVYDPSIQNSTPYLVNVTIEFNDDYYEITEDTPGGELQLTAPLVTSKTTYEIFAFKQGYEPSNTTLIVEPFPSYQLVITVGSYEVDANKAFSVLVTDENANPIPSVTVHIQGQTGTGSQDKTDQEGIATLIAPNKEEIHLIAYKENYTQATKTIWVHTTPGFFESLLSNPLFPVFLAVVILIVVILYVQLSKYVSKKPKNNNYQKETLFIKSSSIKKPTFTNKKHSQIPISSSPAQQLKTTSSQSQHLSKQSITPDKSQHLPPFSHQNTVTSNNRFHQHKWFDDNKNIEEKIDALQIDKNHTFQKKWFSNDEQIEQDIDIALKKKKQQKK